MNASFNGSGQTTLVAAAPGTSYGNNNGSGSRIGSTLQSSQVNGQSKVQSANNV